MKTTWLSAIRISESWPVICSPINQWIAYAFIYNLQVIVRCPCFWSFQLFLLIRWILSTVKWSIYYTYTLHGLLRTLGSEDTRMFTEAVTYTEPCGWLAGDISFRRNARQRHFLHNLSLVVVREIQTLMNLYHDWVPGIKNIVRFSQSSTNLCRV